MQAKVIEEGSPSVCGSPLRRFAEEIPPLFFRRRRIAGVMYGLYSSLIFSACLSGFSLCFAFRSQSKSRTQRDNMSVCCPPGSVPATCSPDSYVPKGEMIEIGGRQVRTI